MNYNFPNNIDLKKKLGKIQPEVWNKYVFKFKGNFLIHDEVITEDAVIAKTQEAAERILFKSHVNLTKKCFYLDRVEEITLFETHKSTVTPKEDILLHNLEDQYSSNDDENY